MPRPIETSLATILYGTRWLLAPLCVELLVAELLVLAQFFRELWHTVLEFPELSGGQVILAVLKLIDLMLVGYLALMIIGAGIASFAPAAAAEPHRPKWMAHGDFGVLKLKILASITAIAAIDLLEYSVDIAKTDKGDLVWEIAILLTFVFSGVLLALTDRLAVEHD
jgi:uncharacterized protein (TIGR00645 family)